MGILVKGNKVQDNDPRIELPNTEIEVMLSDDISALVTSGKMSDSEGLFMQRQLEFIQPNSFDVLYPEYKYDKVFTTNFTGGEGATSLTYRSYDQSGEAEIVGDDSTNSPRVDITGKEYTSYVRTLSASYGYNRQELASAKMTGMPLEARKAEVAALAHHRAKNRLTWFGDADNAVNGLFGGSSGAPWSQVGKSQVSGGKSWLSAATPDEMIENLQSACAKMYADTLMIHRPNMILMSVAAKQKLKNTPRSIHSDVSVLNWFLMNNEFIKDESQIVDVNELKGIYDASGGAFDPAGGKAGGFTVLSLDENVARIREPFPMVHLPVEYKGRSFQVEVYARFAGLEIIRPAAISHHYGIGAL